MNTPAPYKCKFCGRPSHVDPSDQGPPHDYCQESDHDEPTENSFLKITLQVGGHKVSQLVTLAVIETSNAPEVERHAGQAWTYLQNALHGIKDQS